MVNEAVALDDNTGQVQAVGQEAKEVLAACPAISELSSP